MTQYAVIGHSVPRKDGERKITGKARYAGDLRLPNLLHARLVLSAHPHANIRSIDRDQAAQVPGVVGIFAADDLSFLSRDNGSRVRRPLAGSEVRFEGQPIAIVVATTAAAAQDAAGLVDIDYEILPAVTDVEVAMTDGAPLVVATEGQEVQEEASVHAATGAAQEEEIDQPRNASSAKRFRRGDIEQGLREADVVIERTYRTSWVHQSHLEPQSAVAAPDEDGGITVWTSTQGAFMVRAEVAAALGLSQHRVNVVSMEVGGGFGAKYALLDALVAVVSWKLQRPVSLIYTRAEELYAGNPAPGSLIQVTTGARKDGTLTALKARVVVESGAFPGETMQIACMLLGGTYRWPNLDISGYEVLTHKVGAGAYRAPGAPQACFAIEGQMELMARSLELDSLAFRRQNVVHEGDLMPGNNPWPLLGGVDVLDRLAEHPAWKNRERRPGEGVGIALGGWPGGMQAASASCRLSDDGVLQVNVGSVDISGSNTSMAMIAAEAFGISPDAVSIATGDTNTAPFGGPSGGSKTVYTVGAAVQKAALDARRQVLAIAAEKLEAAPEDLEISGDTIGVRGVPGRTIGLGTVAQLSTGSAGFEPILGHGGSAITTGAPAFTVHLARVSVDPDTGEARVLEYVAVQDVGCAINPNEVTGQIHGGVAQGIGWALYEAIPYGDDGRLLGATLMDYALPTADRIPPIDAVLVEVPSANGPYGAKGVGEPPIIPGCAAIANAIFDATGLRPTSLPITPPRLLQTLQERP